MKFVQLAITSGALIGSLSAFAGDTMSFDTEVAPQYGIDITRSSGSLRFKGESDYTPTAYKIISNNGGKFTIHAELDEINVPVGQDVGEIEDDLYFLTGEQSNKVKDGADFINMEPNKQQYASIAFGNIERKSVRAGSYNAIITLTVSPQQ